MKQGDLIFGVAIAFIVGLVIGGVFCYYTDVPIAYQRGAKIALAEGNYRLEAVRGECADLFTEDECAECHTMGLDLP